MSRSARRRRRARQPEEPRRPISTDRTRPSSLVVGLGAHTRPIPRLGRPEARTRIELLWLLLAAAYSVLGDRVAELSPPARQLMSTGLILASGSLVFFMLCHILCADRQSDFRGLVLVAFGSSVFVANLGSEAFRPDRDDRRGWVLGAAALPGVALHAMARRRELLACRGAGLRVLRCGRSARSAVHPRLQSGRPLRRRRRIPLRLDRAARRVRGSLRLHHAASDAALGRRWRNVVATECPPHRGARCVEHLRGRFLLESVPSALVDGVGGQGSMGRRRTRTRACPRVLVRMLGPGCAG